MPPGGNLLHFWQITPKDFLTINIMPEAEDYMKDFETLMCAPEARAPKLDELQDGMPEPEAERRAARLMKILRNARRQPAIKVLAAAQ